MTTINFVCSLGPRCHTAGFLKRNNLKKTSYPFDWIFSNPEMILHCLETDFSIFLEKSYYMIEDVNSKCQQHSFYKENDNEILFNHHNPLKDVDYQYFTRCKIRFRQMLLRPEVKLFTLMYLNYPVINIEFKQRIIGFKEKFDKYTNNYGILCIIQYTSNKQNYRFTVHDNLHFLEIYTLSNSNGVKFDNESDNVFLDNIIKDTYHFDLKENDPLYKDHNDVNSVNVCEPIHEVIPEPIQESFQESFQEPIQESFQEPIQESFQEPIPEPIQEPIQEPIPEPIQESFQEQIPEFIQEDRTDTKLDKFIYFLNNNFDCKSMEKSTLRDLLIDLALNALEKIKPENEETIGNKIELVVTEIEEPIVESQPVKEPIVESQPVEEPIVEAQPVLENPSKELLQKNEHHDEDVEDIITSITEHIIDKIIEIDIKEHQEIKPEESEDKNP